MIAVVILLFAAIFWVVCCSQADRLDTAKQEVLAKDGRIFPYDRLCIATGARPRLLVEGGLGNSLKPSLLNRA